MTRETLLGPALLALGALGALGFLLAEWSEDRLLFMAGLVLTLGLACLAVAVGLSVVEALPASRPRPLPAGGPPRARRDLTPADTPRAIREVAPCLAPSEGRPCT